MQDERRELKTFQEKVQENRMENTGTDTSHNENLGELTSVITSTVVYKRMILTPLFVYCTTPASYE